MSGHEPTWRRYARFFRDDVRRDVDDEFRFHLDRLVEDEVAAGHAPDEAHRRAAERMGDLGRASEESKRIRSRGQRRDQRGRRWTGIGQDWRYALRSLGRSPLFTAVVVATLALGIGANAAVFSIFDHVALRPLPYGDPDRLVALWEHNLPRNQSRNVANPQNALDWRDRARSFESVAIYTYGGLTLTGGESSERVIGRAVTENFFRVLRVRPMLGRDFVPEDSTGGSARRIIISHALWRRRFGGDSAVVGTAVPIAGSTARIVGVMPPEFRPMADEEYWQAWSPGAPGRRQGGRYVMAVARLSPSVTIDAANRELRAIAKAYEADWPDLNTGWSADAVPLLEDVVGDVRQKLLLALGAVSLVLLIACANVGNLILARAAGRQHEMSVRVALGAARGRLVRLWLAEAGLLSLAGSLVGVAMAWALVHVVALASPPDIPRLDEVRIDGRVLLVAAAVAVGVTFLLAVGAALGTAVPATGALRESGARHTAGTRARRFRHGLVVAQMALALVLLQGAGLLLRTLRRVERVNPGFDPAQVVTADVALPGALYGEPREWTAFFRRATGELRAQPGIVDAGFGNAVPLTGRYSATSFHALDRAEPAAGRFPVADIRIADEGYYRALKLPLLRGRLLEIRDDSLPFIVVNDALVRELWPRDDAVGKTVKIAWVNPERAYTIVGVVGDTHSEGLDSAPRPTIYFAPEASPNSGYVLVVRGSGDPASLQGMVRRVIRALDPAVGVRDLSTMREKVSRSLAGRRSPALLLGGFAIVALVLAALGLYGVLAYAVGLRAREIGVRMALGARPREVVWMVVRGGLTLGLGGVAIGAVGAAGTTGVLRDLLYELSPGDPATFAMVAVLLLAAAALASWLPARRAARLDPTAVIRAE